MAACVPQGELCGTDATCCAGLDCVNGLCRPPCLGAGEDCTTAGDCCDDKCAGGLCSNTCKDVGILCSSSYECCSHACVSGGCHDQCNPQFACNDWADVPLTGFNYAKLCGNSKKLADAWISCLCNACESECFSLLTCKKYHYTAAGYLAEEPACKSCLAAVSTCAAEQTACLGDK